MIWKRFLQLAILMAIFGAPARLSANQVLIPTNAVWRFMKGTNTSLGATWRGLSFNDSSWAQVRAPFFYGEPLQGGTNLTDMRSRYSSILLRKTFFIADTNKVTALDLRGWCDDGFVAWINSKPAGRYNFADNVDPTISSYASPQAPEPVSYLAHPLLDPRTYLVNGTNLLAVQVMNVAATSSDLVYIGELIQLDPDLVPPTVTSINPSPGAVATFTRFSITFSEPVQGVHPTDLLVNDISALSVTNSGNTYTFTFTEPALGSVLVRFAPDHGITDQGRPPNSLDGLAPENQWEFTLQDLSKPRLLTIHPPPGKTIQSFQQAELFFSEPVQGLEASDLLVNGRPATNLAGVGTGPYVFQFAPVTSGTATFGWAPTHGIQDLAEPPNLFNPVSWTYTVNPNLIQPNVVINEVMTVNERGLVDEDAELVDWIELYNRGTTAVSLEGWSLTDDPDLPGQWVFPAVNLQANQYLVVYASGKDRVANPARLHTNFKLSRDGEYLGLFNAESPRRVVDQLAPKYPEQRPDYPYGRAPDQSWKYFRSATAGGPNTAPALIGMIAPVHFSADRCLFATAFNLYLQHDDPRAVIRYTTDGREPTELSGTNYIGPIRISRTMTIRAAAFITNYLPSKVETHTYVSAGTSVSARGLPVLSISTAPTNLFGPTGIMEVNPRNTTKHGIAWERPVSVEYIRPEDNGGFQLNAGLRIQGGAYVRERYDPNAGLPFSKYSFRLYFRGDYGPTTLDYPLFPDCAVEEFDQVVLRAGMNDHTNPFLVDELVRRLAADMGQVASHGTFVNLFLNGLYKGYYNPTERINGDFFRSWHGGTNDWDLIAQFGEIQEGDAVAWNLMKQMVARDETAPANYLEAERHLDLVNFADYLLLNIYAGTGDWPHNNWRAARERKAGARFRFYVWDAEWSFGNLGRSVNQDIITTELTRASDITTLFTALRRSPEFRLLMADRAHKHLYNRGALDNTNVSSRYFQLRNALIRVLPSINTTIQNTWLPQRKNYVLGHLRTAGFLSSTNAPAFSVFGGKVRRGTPLAMTNLSGAIYYTLDGSDPRVRFSGQVSPQALQYTQPLRLDESVVIKARSLSNSVWSAVTEAAFDVGQAGTPLRFTEIMYNPGSDAYEFVELHNSGDRPVDLSGMNFEGIEFTFPVGASIAPGAYLILASDEDPKAFGLRYPGLPVFGWFGGALSNGGEPLILKTGSGDIVLMVEYDDSDGWPVEADSGGRSLELTEVDGDLNAPASWRASLIGAGSPGEATSLSTNLSAVLLNEVLAENISAVPRDGIFPDYIELKNQSSQTVSLAGWSVSDSGQPGQFAFPSTAEIGAGGFAVVWCDGLTNAAGFHANFALGKNGESIQLFNAAGKLADQVTYGLQIADRSIGRSPESWQLCVPTPGTANQPVQLGVTSDLNINEWLANSPALGDDWLELHNRSSSHPVALQGIALGNGAAVSRISSLSFIEPSGFIQLHADEQSGPDHLAFKLPAAVGTLILYDEAGGELEKLTYKNQVEGVSQGRLPDYSGSIVSFAGSPSPGASNYVRVYSGPGLSEIMVRNRDAVRDPWGGWSDWVELHFAGLGITDLSGMALRHGNEEWIVPAGTQLTQQQHLLVWCNPNAPASTNNVAPLNAGFSLKENSSLELVTTNGQTADLVEFGFQPANFSLGKIESAWNLLAAPTPGRTNAAAAPLGTRTTLRLNEWMADPEQGSDWFEIHNPDPLPVRLSGLFLANDPSYSGQTNAPISPLSYVGPGGWVVFQADGEEKSGHAPFALDRRGDMLRIYTESRGLIDTIDFTLQSLGISEGRFLDGQTNILDFDGSSSPRAANYLLLTNVVIHEVLTHSDLPLEDAVELFNPGSDPVDISGWSLSDSDEVLGKYFIPAQTVIGPGRYAVFYERDFNPDTNAPQSFSFSSSEGDSVVLSAFDAEKRWTGRRAKVEFGPAENGVSFGRFLTSAGEEFPAQSRRTFGTDHPNAVTEFRTGTGSGNAYPKMGPVVITEVMYFPFTGSLTNPVEDAELEFVELANISSSSVTLSHPTHPAAGWKIRGGVDLDLPAGMRLEPGQTLVLVNFNPATEPAALAKFTNRYAIRPTLLVGPYQGNLNNDGEPIELRKPDSPELDAAGQIEWTPYVLADRVSYSAAAPWPVLTRGDHSLNRKIAAAYGNEPLNWEFRAPTPGAVNPSIPLDGDGDGLSDSWELSIGLNPLLKDDAQMDADLDGASNSHEYLSSTDPFERASVFAVSPLLANGQIKIGFQAAPRMTYSVQVLDRIGGTWTTVQTFQPETIPVWHQYEDPQTAGQGRFYRIAASPAP